MEGDRRRNLGSRSGLLTAHVQGCTPHSAIAWTLVGLPGLHLRLGTIVLRSAVFLLHPNTHPVRYVLSLLHLGTLTQNPSPPGGLHSRTNLVLEAGLQSHGHLLSPYSESGFGAPFLASPSFSCVLLGSLLDPPELQFSLPRGPSGLWGG